MDPALKIRHPAGLKLRPPSVPQSLVDANNLCWAGRPLTPSLPIACSMLTLDAEAPALLDGMPFVAAKGRKTLLLGLMQGIVADKGKDAQKPFLPLVKGIARMGAGEAGFISGHAPAVESLVFQSQVRTITSRSPARPDRDSNSPR